MTDQENQKDDQQRFLLLGPFFGGSLVSTPQLVHLPSNSANPILTVRKTSPGLMIVICEGKKGEGFYICTSCGAGFRTAVRTHKTAQKQACSGTLENVSLGHEFVTDVIQLQFLTTPEACSDLTSFAYSLAFAIVEGAAEVLEAPSTDLNTTVAHSDQQKMPPIILYDNVPGGAGLVARLENEDMMRKCLEAALSRVSGACGCALNASCYGCLRSL